MDEANPSTLEREVEGQGGRIFPIREDRESQRPATPVPTTSKSPDRVQTPPAPLLGGDMGKASSPQLGPNRVQLPGCQQAVEAAIGSSSLLPEHRATLPEHRATLGTAYSKFQLAEAGIMEAFVSLAKGFEASSSTSATTSVEVEELKRKLARSEEDLNLMRQQAGQHSRKILPP